MRVDVVDPSAYTRPYDHALCAALAAAGAEVTLRTSRFAYGPVPAPNGYALDERFYRLQPGGPGSRVRLTAKLAQHFPDMLRLRRATTGADVVHFQWLTVQHLDAHLLGPRPVVVTAHDVLPREPRRGQRAAQRRLYERADAIVVHSEHGRGRLTADLGLPAEKVQVIPHGAFEHLTTIVGERPLPSELRTDRPVVLCFGLIRPYKGVDVLLDAWRGLDADAELWIVGNPRMDVSGLRAASPPGVRWVPRFVGDEEIAAYFRRADLVVLPYREIDQSGVLFTALAFGAPLLLSDVGGFGEVAAHGAAALARPGDAVDLRAQIERLLANDDERGRLAAAARAAAAGPYAWSSIARRHLELYARLT